MIIKILFHFDFVSNLFSSQEFATRKTLSGQFVNNSMHLGEKLSLASSSALSFVKLSLRWFPRDDLVNIKANFMINARGLAEEVHRVVVR